CWRRLAPQTAQTANSEAQGHQNAEGKAVGGAAAEEQTESAEPPAGHSAEEPPAHPSLLREQCLGQEAPVLRQTDASESADRAAYSDRHPCPTRWDGRYR